MRQFILLLLLAYVIGSANSLSKPFQLPKLQGIGNGRTNNIVDRDRSLHLDLAPDSSEPLIKLSSRRNASDTWLDKLVSMTPIHSSELPKFASLTSMLFWILFIFTMTRDTKDTLIVTYCGAETIAFLKVYLVVPSAALFTLLYTHLVRRYSTQQVFNLLLAPFMTFYVIFAFVLFPLRSHLHPLSIPLPSGGLRYPVNMLRYWTFSLYYLVSEMWGSAGVPLLFWSCANDVIAVSEAKRMYPIITAIGNLAPIFSGLTMSLVSSLVAKRSSGLGEEAAFERSLKLLSLALLVAGGLTKVCQRLVYACVGQEEAAEAIASAAATSSPQTTVSSTRESTVPKKAQSSLVKHSKPKLTVLQSLRVLAADPYLRNIATIVVSYGVTIEFTELLWKSSIKQALPVKSEYLQFMGRYSTAVGVWSFVMMLVGSQVIRSSGWYTGAMMTPAIMAVSALPFFALLLKSNYFRLIDRRALLSIVYAGMLHNVLSKSTKYSVFDPTKEMTYIPLDKQSKQTGKAAIDVLAARLGKSGGAMVVQLLVLLSGGGLALGGRASTTAVVAVLFFATIVAWIGSLNALAPEFEARCAAKQ